MHAIRLGGAFGLWVLSEKQLIGKIILVSFSLFCKSGNEEAERTPDSAFVDHKFLFGVGEAHDLRHRRVHYQVYTVKRIQRGPFVLDQIDCVRKLRRNLIRVSFDPPKGPLLSMLVIYTTPMHYPPPDSPIHLICIP